MKNNCRRDTSACGNLSVAFIFGYNPEQTSHQQSLNPDFQTINILNKVPIKSTDNMRSVSDLYINASPRGVNFRP